MSTNKIISQLDAEQMEKDLPDFGPGDTLVVQVKVKEGNRERLQAFEGVVIAKRNRGLNSAFTVRKISHGEGVERVFQLYSPLVADISVKRRGDVRRIGDGERNHGERGRDDRDHHRNRRRPVQRHLSFHRSRWRRHGGRLYRRPATNAGHDR